MPDVTQVTEQKPHLSREELASVRGSEHVDIDPDKFAELERWLGDTITSRRVARDNLLRDLKKYRKVLAAKRPGPGPAQKGISNVSVPLTIWVASNLRARLDESIFRVLPVVTVEPRDQRNGIEALSDAKAMGDFFQHELLSSEGLGGRQAGKKVIADDVNYGTGIIKVYREADEVRLLRPETPDGEPRKVTIPGRVRWAHIAIDDWIWWDGYGNDTQAMPYVGHEFDRTWSKLQEWATLGHYNKKKVAEVKGFYDTDPDKHSSVTPAALRVHRVAELYTDFVVKSSGPFAGLTMAIKVDYHIESRKVLRVVYNDTYLGKRPILAAVFDVDPDPRKATGQGVCQKMDGAQEETDEVHNLGIEAGKRAAAHLIVIKYGSPAEEELGGQRSVLPGDVVATTDPEKDIVTKALGDPRSAEVAIALEEHSRLYVMRTFGLDEGGLGQLESGKRVPASLGLNIRREGRVPVAAAGSGIAEMLEEAAYITFELWKETVPEAALRSVLPDDVAERLLNSVFQLGSPPVKDRFVIRVNAQDAASIQEERRSETMMLLQLFGGIFDKILAYAQLAEQVPPQYKPIVLEVLAKLENLCKLLMAHVESVPNAAEVIPEVAARLAEIGTVGASVRGETRPSIALPEEVRTEPGEVEARGAGVV